MHCWPILIDHGINPMQLSLSENIVRFMPGPLLHFKGAMAFLHSAYARMLCHLTWMPPLLFMMSSQAYAINLGMSAPHYAQQMEFYYQKPKPALIGPMLKNFCAQGILSHSENRLMLAAFLAQLARQGSINLTTLANAQSPDDLRHTVAWSIHLAGMSAEKELLSSLLGKKDRNLELQILGTPANLRGWLPPTEKSVVQMFLAAFMATGNPVWIDDIIAMATRPVRPSAHYRQDINLRNYAAATLYDYAQRHAAIRERVKKRLRNAGSEQKRILIRIIGDK